MRIAFAGPRAVGKTTLAQYLVDHHGFTLMSLAGPIKRIAREAPAAPQARYQYLRNWAKELFPTQPLLQARFVDETEQLMVREHDPGRLAQQIGTDVGRALDVNVWVRYLLTHLPHGRVAVDDVRFPNECQRLREAGFLLVRLKAPADVLASRLAARPGERRDPDHPSEHGLDGIPDDYWDAVWDTSEPLEMTVARLEQLLKQV